MDKKRYFITGVIVLAVALVYVFLVKVQKPGLDMRISLEKDTFLYGEDFDVKYTLENLSDNVDSVLHFGEGYLSCESLMIESNGEIGVSGIPGWFSDMPVYKFGYIKPKEKFIRNEKFYFWRGTNGHPFFRRFTTGDYILRGISQIDTNGYIFSNTVAFHVVYPSGDDLKAFEIYMLFEDYNNQFYKRRCTQDDNILLTDKAIEVLYKYPKSVYSGMILCQSNTYRSYGKYKYDESYLKDMEFFIENNPNSYYLNKLLFIIGDLFHQKLGGKEKAVEYLNSLKTKFNNERLNKLIDEHMIKDDYLREVKW